MNKYYYHIIISAQLIFIFDGLKVSLKIISKLAYLAKEDNISDECNKHTSQRQVQKP